MLSPKVEDNSEESNNISNDEVDNTPERPRARGRRKHNKNSIKFLAGNACRYPVVRKAAAKLGWKIVEEDASEKMKNSCNIIWVDTSNINDYFLSIQPWQRINHFPGMTHIARKTRLAEHLACMKKRFYRDYSFYPSTFVLPRDKHNMKKLFDTSGKSKVVYIVKPDGGCQGRGIFLTKTWDSIESITTTHVAQRYINDPMLIDNKKFDLRIYVLVTSCDPLRIYLFQDGLVRLCTQDFVKPNLNNLDNTCMHLSNYSINKHSNNFTGSEDSAGSSGSKRSVIWFLSWLAETRGKGEAEKLWCKIEHICVKTILSIEPILVREYKCTFGLNSRSLDQSFITATENVEGANDILNNNEGFHNHISSNRNALDIDNKKNKNNNDETKKKKVSKIVEGSRSLAILGFDVMVDSKLKPHLIEVNHLPSFATDSPLDEAIKSKVVLQALSVINAASTDKKAFETQAKILTQRRLFRGACSIEKTNNQFQVENQRKIAIMDEAITSSSNSNDRKESIKDAKNYENIEAFLTDIYSTHAPEKIDKIHQLLHKYQGHEEWLVKKLKEKYCSSEPHENKKAQLQEVEAKTEQSSLSFNAVEKMQQSFQFNMEDSTKNHKDFFVVDSNDGDCGDGDSNESLSLTELGCESEILDEKIIHEDNILVDNGNYTRIYPPKQGKYKAPAYQQMKKYAAEQDVKRQIRLVCPLWQLRKYERQDENAIISTSTGYKHQTQKSDQTGYCTRGDWLVHGNIHKKSENIPTKNLQLPSQKQKLAAERLSRGYSVESFTLVSEEELNSQVDGMDFVKRLSLAEEAGKEIRRRNEEKFVSRSQLNINPVNIAFENVPTPATPLSFGERCYVDFAGRKLGYR